MLITRPTQKEHKSDSRKNHNTVKYLTGDKQGDVLPSCDNKLQLANNMTQYFSNKIHKIRQEISENNAPSPHCNTQEHYVYNQSAFSKFEELDLSLFKQVLKEMNSKPHPNDPAPVWLLKSCCDALAPVLLYIVNRSLCETFPDPLKHAVVRPKIKDTDLDKEDNKSYRPLSNLPFLSKLIEKCANSQLI